MYYPMLIGLIFLSMAIGLDAMKSDAEFIQLRNTTPERRESHNQLIQKKESIKKLPKVETGVLEGNGLSTSPREKLRRDSANRIKEQKTKS